MTRRQRHRAERGIGEGELGSVYLLHFEPPYKHAGRYIGWTQKSVQERWVEHVSGKGSPLVRAAVEAGCAVVIARVWEAVDRHFERDLKDQKNSTRLDPITQGELTLADAWAMHHAD